MMRHKPFRQSQTVQQAEQSHAARVSTESIIRRYLGGDPSLLAQAPQAQFYDHTREPTRSDMLNAVADARTKYERLPAAIKRRFASYQQMMQYLSNPANREDAIKIGLIDKPVEPDVDHNTELLTEIRDALKLDEQGGGKVVPVGTRSSRQ